MHERKVNITRIDKDKKSDEIDTVLVERAIDIYVDSNPIANIICLPKDLKELAVGFIFSLGLINSFSEIKNLEVNKIEGSVHIHLFDPLTKIDDIFEINPRLLQKSSRIDFLYIHFLILVRIDSSIPNSFLQNLSKISGECSKTAWAAN